MMRFSLVKANSSKKNKAYFLLSYVNVLMGKKFWQTYYENFVSEKIAKKLLKN